MEEEEAMVADRGSVEENYYNRVDYTRDEFVIVYTKSGNLYSNSYILAAGGGRLRGAADRKTEPNNTWKFN